MKDIMTNDLDTCPFCGRKSIMSFSGTEPNETGFGDLTVQFWCKCGAASNRIDFSHLTEGKQIYLDSFIWVWKEKGYDNCGRDKRYCTVRCCCWMCDKSKACEYFEGDN